MFSKHILIVVSVCLIFLFIAKTETKNETIAQVVATTNLSGPAIMAGQSFKLRCKVEHFNHNKNGYFYLQFLSSAHFLFADYFIPGRKI